MQKIIIHLEDRMIEICDCSIPVLSSHIVCCSETLNICSSDSASFIIEYYLTERVLMEPVTTIKIEMETLNWTESVLHILQISSTPDYTLTDSWTNIDDALILHVHCLNDKIQNEGYNELWTEVFIQTWRKVVIIYSR